MSDTSRIIHLLNFGRKLSESIIKQIEEQTKATVIEEVINVNLDLSKNTYIQIVNLIDKISRDSLKVNENHRIIVNLCGLPLAAVYIITELHARIGTFVPVLELTKDINTDGIFANFKLKRIIDLERERIASRSRMFGD